MNNKLSTAAMAFIGALGVGSCDGPDYVLSEGPGNTTPAEQKANTYFGVMVGEPYECREWQRHPLIGVNLHEQVHGTRKRVAAAVNCRSKENRELYGRGYSSDVFLDGKGGRVIYDQENNH